MPKKRWHVYITRGPRGTLMAGATNDPHPLDALYLEPCGNRTEALSRAAAITKLTRAEKLAHIKASARRPTVETLPGKLYQVRNEGFVCSQCGKKALPTQHDMPRNHCPFCLFSQHVDIHPGDRMNPCRGLLEPIALETSGKKGYVIVYRCAACGELTRAKAALKSTIQPDDFDKLIELSRRALKKRKPFFMLHKRPCKHQRTD